MFKPQGLFRATATLGAARIFYQLLVFVQFAYFLYAFGSTWITDALIAAQTLPFLLSNLFNRGFTHTLIPIFTDFREKKGEEEAWRFSSSLILFSLLALFCMMLVIIALAPILIKSIAPGFSPEDQKLAASLLRYLSVFLILNGISGIPRCLFFAYRSFTVPAITSLFLSLSVIVSIFLLKDSIGIFAVVVGTIVGSSAQLAILWLCVNAGEKRFKFTFHFWHGGIKQFGALIGPRFISIAIARLNVIVDRWFASFLGPAFISALSYADRVCTAPMEFINASFGAVIVPILSRDAALGDKEKFRDRICQYIRIVIFVIMPVTIFFIILGKPLIQILFERGAFGGRGVPLTSAALGFYSIGLLPLAVGTILRGGFFALKDTVTPLKVGIVSFFLNIILDYILVKYLSIRGLALATSLVQGISAILLLILIQKEIGPIGLRELNNVLGRVVLAGATMAIVVWFLSRGPVLIDFHDVLVERSFRLATAILFGGLIYFLTCRSLQVKETAIVIAPFQKIGSRFRRRNDRREI